MKKLSVFLLIFIFIFVLVGCNKDKEKNGNEDKEKNEDIVIDAVPPNLADTPKILSITKLKTYVPFTDNIDELFAEKKFDALASDNTIESMKKYVFVVEKAHTMNMTFLEYMDYLGIDVPEPFTELYSDDNYMTPYNYCKEQLSINEIK